MLPSWIAAFADLCGIFSFIFSIVIWNSTNKIKKQISLYKSNQKEIIIILKGHRESLIKDGLNSLYIRSNLRTELYAILQNYSSLLSPFDKSIIYITETKNPVFSMLSSVKCRNSQEINDFSTLSDTLFYPLSQNQKYLQSGFHPNPEGYRKSTVRLDNC